MSHAPVLVAGEAIVDMIPVEGSSDLYARVLGGSGFNTAIGMGRLDAPTGFCGTLSRDANGERFIAALKEANVQLGSVRRTAAPSPLAFVAAGTAASAAQYSFYMTATAFDEPPSLPADIASAYGHLHMSSFFALVGPGGAAMLTALRELAGLISTSFDPNIRPAMVPDRAATIELVETRVALATIVKVSAEDLGWLFPGVEPHQVATRWALLGPRLVVLTRGENGATAFFGGEVVSAVASPIEIADTIGAGDSFMAALLAILHAEGALGPAALRPDLNKAGRWLSAANAAAAITCARRGANPPTLAEVAAAKKLDRAFGK